MHVMANMYSKRRVHGCIPASMLSNSACSFRAKARQSGVEACEFHAWAPEPEDGECSTQFAVTICDETRKPFEINTLNPWPGCRVVCGEMRVNVDRWIAKPLDSMARHAPGIGNMFVRRCNALPMLMLMLMLMLTRPACANHQQTRAGCARGCGLAPDGRPWPARH